MMISSQLIIKDLELIQTRIEGFAKIGYVFPEKKYQSIGLQLSHLIISRIRILDLLHTMQSKIIFMPTSSINPLLVAQHINSEQG
jgi:hypothetical protein